jgi:hypothetical protein
MRINTACSVWFSPADSAVKRRALTRHDLAMKLRQWITIEPDQNMPLYLITLFAKGDRANLTQAERNDLRELVDKLISISLRKLN